MKMMLRIAAMLFWIGLLIMVGALILLAAASRVGEHKASTYGQAYFEFERSWGGEIGVIPPEFYLLRTYQEREYNTTAEEYETVTHTQTIKLIPQRIVLTPTLNYGLQYRNWLVFNAFEVQSEDHYWVVNDTEYDGVLLISTPKPHNANLMHNHQIHVDDRSSVIRPSEENTRILDEFEQNQTVQVKIEYDTKGMDIFKYNLSAYQSSVVAQLTAHLTLNTPVFDVYRFGLPHTITTTEQGATIDFVINNFSTTQDLGVMFESKQTYLDHVQSMLNYSPLALAFYMLIVLAFSQIQGVRFNPFHYLFIGVIHLFYFLFVAYLVRFFDVWTTYGLATVLTGGMFLAYCPAVLGWRFATRVAGIYLFALTVIFSLIFLLPIFRGLMFVSLIFVIFVSIMIPLGRSNISEWAMVRGND